MDTLYIVIGAIAFLLFLVSRRKKQILEIKRIAYDREKNLIAVTIKNNKPVCYKFKGAIRAKFEQIKDAATGAIPMAAAQANGRPMFNLVSEDDLPRTIAPNETMTITYRPMQSVEDITHSSNLSVDLRFIEYGDIAGTDFETEFINESKKEPIIAQPPTIETLPPVIEPIKPILEIEPIEEKLTETPTKLESPIDQIDIFTDIDDIEARQIKIPVIDLFKEPEEIDIMTDPIGSPEDKRKPKTPWTAKNELSSGRYVGNRVSLIEIMNRLDKLKTSVNDHTDAI